MNENEFLELVLSGSKSNKELETQVENQKYVFAKYKRKIIKLNLISIMVFPYGTFDVGNWNGKEHKPRITLNWEDYGKTWALTKGELL